MTHCSTLAFVLYALVLPLLPLRRAATPVTNWRDEALVRIPTTRAVGKSTTVGVPATRYVVNVGHHGGS